MVITFVFTLLVPLQYAVLIGVALAILLFVFNQSNKIVIKEWTLRDGQLPVEQDVPKVVPPNQITVLVPFGSLFFAAVQTFEEELPDVDETTRNAVIILSLRNRAELGSTFLGVLDRYAEDLQDHRSKLMLAEVSRFSKGVIEQTGQIRIYGRENIFEANDVVGESIVEAHHAAEMWLAEREDEKPESELEKSAIEDETDEENS
jgi:SulP family sulfate permease